MRPSDVAVDVLLSLGVACEVVCCLGVLAFANAFDRLHFASAGSTLGPLLIGAAVLVRQRTSAAGIETIVTVALVLLLAPALVIATARAARRAQHGGVEATAEERRRA